MWDDDWDRLGLEPTTDLAAIKKAYALKLKVTRPDDDPAAYQALREAYDNAQVWVRLHNEQLGDSRGAGGFATRRQTEEAKVLAVQEAVEANAADAPPRSSLATSREDLVRVAPLDMATLTAQLDRALAAGHLALFRTWHLVQTQLENEPLSARSQHALAFARWVLSKPDLPDNVLHEMETHFGWLSDFRVARGLEPMLMEKLESRLTASLQRPVTDIQLLGVLDQLRDLHSFAQAKGKFWALIMAALSLSWFERLQCLVDPRRLRDVGLDASAQCELGAMLGRARWIRAGTAVLLLLGVAYVANEGLLDALIRVPTVVGAMVIWHHIAGFLGAPLSRTASVPGLGGKTWGSMLPLNAWRHSDNQPFGGLALLLIAALAFLCDVPGWFDVASSRGIAAGLIALAAAGIVVGWPRDEIPSRVIVGLAPLVIALFVAWKGANWGAPAAILFGVAWLLIGAGIAEDRIPAGALLLVFAPVINSIALGKRWGVGFAMFPVVCAGVTMALPDFSLSTAAVAGTWFVTNLVLVFVQPKIDQWVRDRLALAKLQ